METAQVQPAEPSREDSTSQAASAACTDSKDVGQKLAEQSMEPEQENKEAVEEASQKPTDRGEEDKVSIEKDKHIEKEAPAPEANPFQIAPLTASEPAAHVIDGKTNSKESSAVVSDAEVKGSELTDESHESRIEGEQDAGLMKPEQREEQKASQDHVQTGIEPSVCADMSDDQQLVASLAAAAFGEAPAMCDVETTKVAPEIDASAPMAEGKVAGQANRTDDNEAVAMLLGLSQSESTEMNELAERPVGDVKGAENQRPDTKTEAKTPRKPEPGSSKKGKAHHEQAKAKKGQESTPNAKKTHGAEKGKAEGEEKPATEPSKSKRERENAEKSEETATPGKEKDSKKKPKKQLGEQIQQEKSLSREERKMLAYMRQFEELERRQQKHEHPGTPREKHDSEGHEGKTERVESKSHQSKSVDVKYEAHGSANEGAGQGARGDGEAAETWSASNMFRGQEQSSADAAADAMAAEDSSAEDGSKMQEHIGKHFSHHNTSGANQQWRGTKGHGVRMGNMLKTCYKLTDKQRQAMEVAAGGGLLLLRAFKAGAEKRAPCVRFLKVSGDADPSERETQQKKVVLDAQTWINAAKFTNQNRLNPRRRCLDRRKFPVVKRILHLWNLESTPSSALLVKGAEIPKAAANAEAGSKYRLKHEKGGHLERFARNWRQDSDAPEGSKSVAASAPQRGELQVQVQGKEEPAASQDAQTRVSQEERGVVNQEEATKKLETASVSVKDEIRSFVDQVAAVTRIHQPPLQPAFAYQDQMSTVSMDFMAGKGNLDLSREMHLQRGFHDVSQNAFYRRSAWDQLPTDQPPPYKQENKFGVVMHDREMERGGLTRGFRPPKFADPSQSFLQRRRCKSPRPGFVDGRGFMEEGLSRASLQRERERDELLRERDAAFRITRPFHVGPDSPRTRRSRSRSPRADRSVIPPHKDCSLSPRSREFQRELQATREHRRAAESLDTKEGKPEEGPAPQWAPMMPWTNPHPVPMPRKERPSMFDSRSPYPKPSPAR
mmetsp:Transcript_36211/g.81530  ORF Transcript_36211/g.81530 Transcript_36211/m.81530 type:complete len:1008 (-) Transcript_36211:187-3210(-)